MPKWARDYLLLPLTVGVVLAIVAFGLPILFSDKLELSYEIDRPTAILEDPAIRQVKVEVNGAPVTGLEALRARIWNSGDKPIHDLPVRIVFDAKTDDFSILNTTHQTTPPFEFGKIEEIEASPQARRYKYELLNPGDEDVLTFLTTGASGIELFAKSAGLSVIRREATDVGLFERWISFLALVLGVVASLLSMVIRAFQDKNFRSLREGIGGRKGGGRGGG